MKKLRELLGSLNAIKRMVISSQDQSTIGKVQRLSLRGVESSDSKRGAPHAGDDIVWPNAETVRRLGLANSIVTLANYLISDFEFEAFPGADGKWFEWYQETATQTS